MTKETKPSEVVGWLSISEAAARVGCTRDTIYKAIESGALRGDMLVGKRVVAESDVDTYKLRIGGKREGAGRKKKETTHE